MINLLIQLSGKDVENIDLMGKTKTNTFGKVVKVRKQGLARQQKIIETVERGKFFTREQLEQLFFRDIASSRTVCSRVLKRLADRKQLKRKRTYIGEQFTYYVGSWNQKAGHYVLLNWVYVALVKYRPKEIWLHTFLYEYFCEIHQDDHFLADGLAILKDTKQIYPLFVEADMGTNQFQKFEQFNRWYESRRWTETWWAKAYRKEEAFRFPQVVVVCRDLKRKNKLLQQEKEENRNGLRFVIMAEEELSRIYDKLNLNM